MKFSNFLLVFFIIFQLFTVFVYSEKATSSSKLNESSQQVYIPALDCPCALSFPQCCTPEFTSYICDCAPKPICGACENMLVNVHDNKLKIAMKDASNQQDLAKKAKLQVDLFQKAQDFAKEVGIQEMRAKQYASQLNDATRKAKFARSMMFQAAAQIRNLADQTVKAIQPIKCIGVKCNLPLRTDSTIFSAMMFKQKNDETNLSAK